MKKIVLSIFTLSVLILSLTSCAIFQGEMNVSGSWKFSWHSSGSQRDNLSMLTKKGSETRSTGTASVDLIQNGTALSGTWHGQNDFALTGTIDKSGSIKFSMSINGVECEVAGTVTGENSVFKKEGNLMSGIMRFKYLSQTLSYPFTATRK